MRINLKYVLIFGQEVKNGTGKRSWRNIQM